MQTSSLGWKEVKGLVDGDQMGVTEGPENFETCSFRQNVF